MLECTEELIGRDIFVRICPYLRNELESLQSIRSFFLDVCFLANLIGL
jgi:hypothetical protein